MLEACDFAAAAAAAFRRRAGRILRGQLNVLRSAKNADSIVGSATHAVQIGQSGEGKRGEAREGVGGQRTIPQMLARRT